MLQNGFLVCIGQVSKTLGILHLISRLRAADSQLPAAGAVEMEAEVGFKGRVDLTELVEYLLHCAVYDEIGAPRGGLDFPHHVLDCIAGNGASAHGRSGL